MEQVFVNSLILGMNYALIALGLTLIFAIMNVLNFAHGQMYVLGGFITYYALRVLGLPFVVGLVASVAVLVLIGMLSERLLFRRVIRVSTREESTMLLAAGLALLLESLILLFFGEKQRGMPPVISGVYQVFGVYIPAGRAFIFAIALASLISFVTFMQFTRPGRALRAIAQDKEVTALQGVNINRYGALGFALGAGLTGLAGSLLATVFAVNSGLGTAVSIKAFIMVMLGGAGVVSGAIAGAFVLGFLESFGYAYIPGSMTYMLIFAGMIIFLVFRPQGIMGKPWG
ncbi:MAG TPA: branched-chain amino acid ABC transporter permease [Gammaproteobacteria bacterium]|nr:branched-chain amino acid ABC transporter permease [Gammaproteobacteria bacterium]